MTDPIGAPNAPLNIGVNGLYKDGQLGAGATLKGAFNTDGAVSPHYSIDAGYYLNGKRKFDAGVGAGVLFNFTKNVGLDLGVAGTLGFVKAETTTNRLTVDVPDQNLTIINDETVTDFPMLSDAKAYADLRFKLGSENPTILSVGASAGKYNMPKGTNVSSHSSSRAVDEITGASVETHASAIMNPESTAKLAFGPRLGIEQSFGNFYVGASAEYLPQLKNQVNASVTLGLRFGK